MKGHVRTVNGIRRPFALLSHILAASAAIGPEGGEIAIPDAGLRISIPPGALTSTSTISVQADPHVAGFTATMTPEQSFAKRLRVEQRIDQRHIDEAHTDPPFLVGLTDDLREDAECSELYAGRVLEGAVVAHVPHLSGYLVATGNGYEPCDPTVITDGTCVWVDDS